MTASRRRIGILLSVARRVGLAAAVSISAPVATAHEVLPSIADIRVGPERLEFDVELTAEALVAGIDLRGLVDTNAAPQSDAYDRLRALPAAEMSSAVRRFWPQMREGMAFVVDGAEVVPDLAAVEVPPVGNVELPRKTILRMTAALPESDAPVRVGWAPDWGALVVREDTGDRSDPGYTGYLTDGALSEPIPRRGGGFFGLFDR